MRKKHDFVKILNEGEIHNFLGVVEPSLFVLDTGTIIDLEDHYRHDKNNYDSPVELLDIFSMKHPLIITKGVLNEVICHNEHNVINNRPEISNATRNLVERLYHDSQDIINNSRDESEGVENIKDVIRYNVYWASKNAFKGDYKKGVKDVISHTDKEIVSNAFFLRGGKYLGKPIESLDILSPDSHIKKTVQTLGNTEHNYSGVRVLNTRNCLKKELIN